MLHRLRTDVELKKQVVAVALIATIITVFEAILFFAIVSPQVKGQLHWMLRQDQKILQGDPLVQALARCMMVVAHDREERLVNHNNRGAILHAALVATLPVVLIVAMWVSSAPLRQARWKPILIDVFVTVLCIGLFQIAFYFFGKNWRYASLDGMMADVCGEYKIRMKDTMMPDCGPCTLKLRDILLKSPMLRGGLTKLQHVTIGDILRQVGVSEVAAFQGDLTQMQQQVTAKGASEVAAFQRDLTKMQQVTMDSLDQK